MLLGAVERRAFVEGRRDVIFRMNVKMMGVCVWELVIVLKREGRRSVGSSRVCVFGSRVVSGWGNCVC